LCRRGRYGVPSGALNLTAGAEYTVGLDVRDEALAVYVDGWQYAHYNLSAHVCRRGSVGLRTFYSDVVARNLTVANASGTITGSAAWAALPGATSR
jgi:hypothetical protein